MQSSGIHADVFEQFLEKGESPSGVIITFQVMAVSRVSAGDPHPVGPVPERSQNELGAHTGRARHADDTDVGRILEAAHSGQIRGAVTAPVTEERRDLGLPVAHTNTPSH